MSHKCHICHSELETDSDAATIGRTRMDTNEYRCPVSTNKEKLSSCPIISSKWTFFYVILQGTARTFPNLEFMTAHHSSEASAVSQMTQLTAHLLEKPCVYIFFQ